MAYIVASEPGQSAQEWYGHHCSSWGEMLTQLKLLKSGDHPYKTIVIDTAPGFYRQLEEKLCRENKEGKLPVNHIDKVEGGYGKGKDIASNQFFNVLQELCSLPYGVILIGHSIDREVEPASGEKYIKSVIDLPDKKRSQFIGQFDPILFMTWEKRTTDAGVKWARVLKTQPTPFYEAGDRHSVLPPTIELPDDPDGVGSYQAFIDAFESGVKTKETRLRATDNK